MQAFDSFRTRLLLFTTAVLVLPAMLFGVIAYSQSSVALKEVIGRHFTSEAHNAARAIAMEFSTAVDILHRAARQDLMRDLRVGDIDKRISGLLAGLAQNTPGCAELLVVDAEGSVVSASRPGRIGGLFRKTVSIRGALAGRDVLSRPQSDGGDDLGSVRIAVPVWDPDRAGRTLGALIGRFEWKALTKPLQTTYRTLLARGLRIETAVLDGSDAVIRAVPASAGDLREGKRLALDRLPDPGPDRSFRTVYTMTLGDRVLVVGHAELRIPQLGKWRVVVAEPAEAALMPVRRMARILLLTFLTTLAVAILFALVEGRRFTRPLSELTRAIENLSSIGSAPEPVSTETYSELRILARTFNRMASDLHRAQHELVEAAKFAFVGELAAGVAHEIRTPLGVLKSSAQLLQQSCATDSRTHVEELVQIIGDEILRVDRVVGDLTDLARPRNLRLEPAPLGPIIFRALAFVESQAREKHIRIRRRQPQKDPLVLCDRELLYQVALNLIVNAMQMLPPGGTLTISVEEERNGTAAFEVRDDGPGIPAELLPRIFLPFVSHRDGGTGLGLTFVQRVVREHHGSIDVVSASGEGGTCFRVELPVAEAL